MALVLVVSICAVVAAPASAITTGVVTPNPTTAKATAQYNITFVHTAAAPVGTVISLTFSSAVGLPTSISYSHVRQGAAATAPLALAAETTYASTDPVAVVSGQTIQLALKNAATAGQFISITFSQLAGITNPSLAAATYTVTIASSVLGEATVASAAYTITRSVTFTPSRGPSGTAVTVNGVGFASNSSVDITDAGAATIGSGVTDSTGAFSVACTARSTSGGAITATDGAGNTTASTAVFTVTAKIVTSPTSGRVGTTVTVTITGLTAGASYCLGWTNAPISMATVTTGTLLSPGIGGTTTNGAIASAAGTIVCTIAVPVNLSAGPKTLDIRLSNATPAAFTALANFTAAALVTTAQYEVTGRTITLSPATGAAGTSTTITGAGFSSYATAVGSTIVCSGGVTFVPAATFATTSDGAFAASVTMPSGTAAGTYTITATDSNGNAASASFVIPAAAAATITMSPETGTVGSSATITGANFRALSTVTVTFTTPVPAVTSVVGTGSTDSAGNCMVTFTVPASAVGFATVTVTDAAGTARSRTFTVTVGAAMVTVTDGFSSVAGKYTKVWAFDAATQSWKLYDSAAPAVSDLSSLTRGMGYWLEVTENCTLTYGVTTYALIMGWNLIGWLG
jgi:hypothetical protein